MEICVIVVCVTFNSKKNNANIFQLSNPVVFVSTGLWEPENLIIKLSQAINETTRVFDNLSYRVFNFSVICGPDLKCDELGPGLQLC